MSAVWHSGGKGTRLKNSFTISHSFMESLRLVWAVTLERVRGRKERGKERGSEKGGEVREKARK